MVKPMQVIKSKTLGFNTIVPAVAGLLFAFGIELPENVVVGIIAIGNYVLRFFTKAPVTEK